MSQVDYSQIDDDILRALEPPGRPYKRVMWLLALGMFYALAVWTYQVRMGMGVAGINHPVGWAVYITNFVFWVGIAHSGTLISAILHLVRAKWRAAVSRSAEAMTIIAIATAGLFPLIHLGRLWVFYYIVPYPSQRDIWPDFVSPLVWDVIAISTYLTVSTIFFYVGMLPDLASVRDEYERRFGPHDRRTALYRRLALGWHGSGSQWRNYGRGYLYFAALATPLVVSVHSVVSWDFAMSLLPGWHTTIFAPYFVAGAIHSGLAMVLVLLIPMRKLLSLQKLITIDHFESVAKTMIVTGLIVAYAYVLEPFIAWYSQDTFERQFAWWRATGFLAVGYWALFALNVVAPLLFFSRRIRRSIPWLVMIGAMVVIGMWAERYVIIVGSTAHDFMPHNWSSYAPRWPEYSITAGAFIFFLFWFLGFSKKLPTVPTADVKELVTEEKTASVRAETAGLQADVRQMTSGVLAIFAEPAALLSAVKAVIEAKLPYDTFSPSRLPPMEPVYRRSPVGYWTLFGALTGLASGFALAIGSALVNSLIVGGKPPVAIIPYCIIGFEGTILFGAISNLIGLLVHCHLGHSRRIPAMYDRRFSRDHFGLFIPALPQEMEQARNVLAQTRPEELHVIA